jgi:hypothetical protein
MQITKHVIKQVSYRHSPHYTNALMQQLLFHFTVSVSLQARFLLPLAPRVYPASTDIRRISMSLSVLGIYYRL